MKYTKAKASVRHQSLVFLWGLLLISTLCGAAYGVQITLSVGSDCQEGATHTQIGVQIDTPTNSLFITLGVEDGPHGALLANVKNPATSQDNVFLDSSWDVNNVFYFQVDCVDDFVDRPDRYEAGSVIVTNIFGTAYDQLDLNTLKHKVYALDNDAAGITFNPVSTAQVTEGSTVDYLMILQSEPEAEVTIALTTDQFLSTSPTSLTFTAAGATKWNIPQTVTISGIPNSIFIDKGVIQHAVTSTDGNYGGYSIPDTVVNIVDDDVVGIVAATTTTTITEGSSFTYTVKLSSEPLGDVTITVAAGTINMQADTTTLVFNPTDWNIDKTATVTAVEDNILTVTGDITFTASSTDDTFYNAASVVTKTVNVNDNDVAALVLTKPGTDYFIKEAQASDYTLSLVSKPDSDIQVVFTALDSFVQTPDPVTFTPTDWNVPKTLSVFGTDDNQILPSPYGSKMSFQIVTVDAEFSVPVGDGLEVQVVLQDTDVPGVNIVKKEVLTPSIPEGRPAVYLVTLPNMPYHPVTIAFSSLSPYIETTTTTLTFQPNEWNVAKELTITSVEDAVITKPSPYNAKFHMDLTSTDTNYHQYVVEDFTVTIEDNDREQSLGYSSMTWKTDPAAGRSNVVIDLEMSFGYTHFDLDAGDSHTVKLGKLDYGDGTFLTDIPVTLTTKSQRDNAVVAVASINHQYPSKQNNGLPWVLTLSLCCRSGDLRNNKLSESSLIAKVDMTEAEGPLMTTLPLIHVPVEQAAVEFFIVASSSANPLSYSLSSVKEIGSSLGGASQTLTIDPSTGKITWDTRGIPTGRWSLVVSATDLITGLSSSIEHIVFVESTTANNVPVFTSGTTSGGFETKFLTQGVAFTHTLTATDADSNPITYESSSLPATATFTGDTLTWTPSADQVDDHVICFQALDDQGGFSLPDCLKLIVSSSALTPPTVAISDAANSRDYQSGVTSQISMFPGGVTITATQVPHAKILIEGYSEGDTLEIGTVLPEIIATYDSGILLLTGATTAANYQTVIGSILYKNSKPLPKVGTRKVSVVVSDGASYNTYISVPLTVSVVNQIPVLDLTADTTTVNYATTFVADSGDLALIDPTATTVVTDADSDIVSATLTMTGVLDGGDETLKSLIANDLQDTVTGTHQRSSGTLSIPFGSNAQTITNSLDITDLTGEIVDVKLVLNIRHNWVGDIRVQLQHDGKSITVIEAPGGNECSEDDITNAVFDDLSTVEAHKTLSSPGVCAYRTQGIFKPQEPLSTFSAQSPAGVWILTVSDSQVLNDDGFLLGWSLIFRLKEPKLPAEVFPAIARPLMYFGSSICSRKLPYHVTADGQIKDINVELQVSSEYVDKMTFKLVHPDGTSVTLMDQRACAEFDLAYTVFDDEATVLITDPASCVNGNIGTFKPSNALSAFHGKRPQGEWVLEVTTTECGDVEGGTGSINGFQLVMITVPNIVVNYDASTTTMSLTGADSALNYQTVLKTMVYNNIVTRPTNTNPRTISIVVNDASLQSSAVTSTINIHRIELDLDTSVVSADNSRTFVESVGSIGIVDSAKFALQDTSRVTGDYTCVVIITNVLNAGKEVLDFGTLDPKLVATPLDETTKYTVTLTVTEAVDIALVKTALEGLTYKNAAIEPDASAARVVTIQVFDTRHSSVVATSTVAIETNNDRPVLSGTLTFTDVNEDISDTLNVGESVADIISGHYEDTDLNAKHGIAIIDVDNANGKWQVFNTTTNQWENCIGDLLVGLFLYPEIPTLEKSTLLSDTDKLRFVPDLDFFGETSITIKAWDSTGNTDGWTGRYGAPFALDSTNLAFSVESKKVTMQVLPINDAPEVSFTNTADFVTQQQTINRVTYLDYNHIRTNFTENDAFLALTGAASLFEITDVDDTYIRMVSVVIENALDVNETISVDNSTVTTDWVVNGTMNTTTNKYTLTIRSIHDINLNTSAPVEESPDVLISNLASLNTILKTLQYKNPTNEPNPTTRNVSMTVYDSDTNSKAASIEVVITLVDDNPGPAICGFVADGGVDAEGRDTDYFFADGDTIDIFFCEPTNTPDFSAANGQLLTFQVDNLFQFSESIGELYLGQWLNNSHFRIVIQYEGPPEAPANPTLNQMFVTVRKEANLRDITGISLPSEAKSPNITGDWGFKPFEPTGVSVQNEPGVAAGNIQIGSNVKVKVVPHVPVHKHKDVCFGNHFNGNSIGNNIQTEPQGCETDTATVDVAATNTTGLFANALKRDQFNIRTRRNTATVKSKATATRLVYKITAGQITVTNVNSLANSGSILNAGASAAALPAGVSATQVSSYVPPVSYTPVTVVATVTSTVPGPTLLSIVANDPDDGDDIIGIGDTLTFTFDISKGKTSTPPVASKGQIDKIFTFSEDLGNYIGAWSEDTSILIIQITGTPPKTFDIASTNFTVSFKLPNNTGNSCEGTNLCAYTESDVGVCESAGNTCRTNGTYTVTGDWGVAVEPSGGGDSFLSTMLLICAPIAAILLVVGILIYWKRRQIKRTLLKHPQVVDFTKTEAPWAHPPDISQMRANPDPFMSMPTVGLAEPNTPAAVVLQRDNINELEESEVEEIPTNSQQRNNPNDVQDFAPQSVATIDPSQFSDHQRKEMMTMPRSRLLQRAGSGGEGAGLPSVGWLQSANSQGRLPTRPRLVPMSSMGGSAGVSSANVPPAPAAEAEASGDADDGEIQLEDME
eukprot:Nk52_evm9s159 gene=Nk52_evmTU9s159